MKSQEKIQCKICEREFNNYRGLSAHISKSHNINPQGYYDNYLKKENEGICKECGKPTAFRRLSIGYRNFCSIKCSLHSKETKEKFKETCLEKYGVSCPMKNEQIKEKSRNTCLKNYGVNYSLQSEDVRQKRKETMINRYKVEHSLQSKKIKEKMKQKYFEKTGYENPMQNQEIHNKQQISAHKFKHYTMKSGEIRKVQGYEPLALNLLIEKYNDEDILTHKGIPTIKYFYEDKERVYYPDIYIPSENLIIEVKSVYTFEANYEKNLAKQNACLNLGYNFEFWIFDKKGNLEIICVNLTS